MVCHAGSVEDWVGVENEKALCRTDLHRAWNEVETRRFKENCISFHCSNIYVKIFEMQQRELKNFRL